VPVLARAAKDETLSEARASERDLDLTAREQLQIALSGPALQCID